MGGSSSGNGSIGGPATGVGAINGTSGSISGVGGIAATNVSAGGGTGTGGAANAGGATTVFKVVDVPAVAYKAGQANEKLGKWVRASELYVLATKLKPNRLWADGQMQLEAQRNAKSALAALDGRIPTLQL